MNTATAAGAVPERNPIVLRALRLFTVIRPGEPIKALLLTLNSFLIIFGYYQIKPIRNGIAPLRPPGRDPELPGHPPGPPAHLRRQGFRPDRFPLSAPSPHHLRQPVLRLQPCPVQRHELGRGAGLLDGGHLLHLDRDVQPAYPRPVLGIRQRHLFRGRGEAPLPHDRLRGLAGRSPRAHVRQADHSRSRVIRDDARRLGRTRRQSSPDLGDPSPRLAANAGSARWRTTATRSRRSRSTGAAASGSSREAVISSSSP